MRAWSFRSVLGRGTPRWRALALVVGFTEPAGLEVSWDAPPSCPDAATAREEILARLPAGAVQDTLHADVRVRSEDGGSWRVDVELRGDVVLGTRTLHADTCAEALTATAVVVAIAVDPDRDEDESPPPSAPEDRTVPPPPAIEVEDPVVPDEADADPPTPQPQPQPRVETAAPEPAPASPRLEGLSIGVRGGLDFGALPSPSAHVVGRLGLLARRWHLQAAALHRIEVESEALENLDMAAGGRFRLTGGRLGAGPRLAWGRFELPLDAGVEVGAIWARGTGAVEPRTTRRLWVAAVASGGVAWAPIPALAVELGVDGVVPLTRPTFTLGESVELLTVGRGAIRAWLGISGRFSL